jgi:hypothetical protein
LRTRFGRTLLVAVVALTAACGSTVPLAQRRGADAGLDASAPSAAETTGATPGAVDATATSSSAGAVASGATARGARTAGTAAAGSHSPVQVGVGVDSNLAAFGAAFGASSSQPEEKTIAEAIVADINRSGGLAGHPLAPVYTEFDSTSTDWVAQDQAACAAFTQDHHVVAAVRTDDIFGPLDACLAAAKIPLVLYESVFREPAWFRAFPGLRLTPDDPSPVRLYAALADRMTATGRWTPSTKIGLVRYDRGDQAVIERDAIRPALGAHHLALTDAEALHTPESFQDVGTTSAQLAGVILKFRQKGIDHVVFQGGDMSYLFAVAAQSQHYAPQYALTSFDFPNALPAAQLHGAFGVGWQPTDDVLSQPTASAGARRCQHAVAATGASFDTAGADRVYATCDQLYFLQAAYNAAASVGPGALAVGAARLGAGWSPAFTFAVNAFAHPDGVAAYRDLSYDDGCACLAYGSRHDLS